MSVDQMRGCRFLYFMNQVPTGSFSFIMISELVNLGYRSHCRSECCVTSSVGFDVAYKGLRLTLSHNMHLMCNFVCPNSEVFDLEYFVRKLYFWTAKKVNYHKLLQYYKKKEIDKTTQRKHSSWQGTKLPKISPMVFFSAWIFLPLHPTSSLRA